VSLLDFLVVGVMVTSLRKIMKRPKIRLDWIWEEIVELTYSWVEDNLTIEEKES
jgi:hypothetical protein